jgi:hypothetical protein
MSAYDAIKATLPTAADNSLAGCLLRHHCGCSQDCVCGCHSLNKVITVDVIGHIWQPGFDHCAYTYHMSERDVWEYGDDREGIRDWLDGHAGDFQNLTDFRTWTHNGTGFDWADDLSEAIWCDCTGEDY